MSAADINPNVWADGFGNWHASVPMTDARTQARDARRLIAAELRERGESTARLRVARERVTGHGTVIYAEELAPERNFRIGIGAHWHYFQTLDEAKAFAQRIHDRRGVIVGIESVTR